jgi:hypothetical protein
MVVDGSRLRAAGFIGRPGSPLPDGEPSDPVLAQWAIPPVPVAGRRVGAGVDGTSGW